MSTLNDVYWSNEKSTSGLSYVPGVDPRSKVRSIPKKRHNFMKQKQEVGFGTTKQHQAMFSKPSQKQPTKIDLKYDGTCSSSFEPQRVSLKDLCPEDKERVANLIRELAKAGEQKEASEIALNNERKEFTFQLEELKADKARIEEEQKGLLSEFKECQRLLVFYQQKITEEQKEVARDINRLLSESSLNKSLAVSSSSIPRVERNMANDVDQEINVRELEGTNSSNRSVTTSVNMNSRFPDVAGTLGESFLPNQTSIIDTKCDIENPSEPSFRNNRRPDQGNVADKMKKQESSLDGDAEFTEAFEKRIRSLSPNGRRVALLRQKRQLEVEQIHLQQLLSEQEEILRFRQEELKKRHVEYLRRMNHFKQFGTFPYQSSTGDNCENTDEFQDSLRASNFTEISNTRTNLSRRRSRKQGSTPSRARSSYKAKSMSEPVTRFKKSTNTSSRLAMDVKSDSSSTCSSPTLRSVSSSALDYNEKQRRNSLQSKPSFSSYGTSNDVTNTSYGQRKSARAKSDGSLLSESELSSSYRDTPDRVSRNTMNNISTLSDLVTSVEASRSASTQRQKSSFFHSRATPDHEQTDDTMVSVTFDPEDSQLLEDIFFIK